MGLNKGTKSTRSLAAVEADLLKAEDAYADADARLKKAIADRSAALGTINDHQTEMDRLVAEMKERSVPGTKWHPQDEAPAEPLELHSESIVEEEREPETAEASLTSDETENALLDKFSRLEKQAKEKGEDPVLKVVYGPKG